MKVTATFRTLALAAFAGLIAFGCFLRFWKLTAVGLWYDELWTVVGASDRPFTEMYREWIVGDSHPPGFFLFYFAWFKVFPNTEFWARLPSAIAGAITVMYLLLRTDKVLSRDERIMSAAFASLSYIYILYALSVKQYSAVILFATVATVSYLAMAIERRVDRRAGITLCAACLGLAYLNHFAMVYASILLTLLALTFRHNPEALRRIARIGIVFAIGYVPIAYFLYLQLAYSIDAWQPYAIDAFLSDVLPSVFFDDQTFVTGALIVLVASLAVLMVARPRTRQALGTSRNRHIGLIVLAFAGFMLALGISQPIFYIRYFIVILPALFIGLGIVTAAVFPIERGWLAIVPLAFFLEAAATQRRSVGALQREQWDKSVDVVLETRKPDEPIYVLGAKTDKTEFDYLRERDVNGVFFVRNIRFYEYYFRRRGAYDVASRLEVVEPTVESAMELAKRFRNTGTTIHVLAGHSIHYDGEAFAALERVARHIEITRMYRTLVYRVTF